MSDAGICMKDGEVIGGFTRAGGKDFFLFNCPTCDSEGTITFTEKRKALVFTNNVPSVANDADHEYRIEQPCGACGGSGLVSEKVYQRLTTTTLE